MRSGADSALDALAGARYADPFSILGPHRIDRDGIVIRALRPSAERIAVVGHGPDVEMTRSHRGGIFEANFPNDTQIFDYRLRITYPNGYTTEIDDPYRYGRVITDYDLYLFGEGKHTRIYDKLGAHLLRDRRRRRRAFRRLGAQRGSRQRRRRLQRVGRPRPPDAAARSERRLGDLHPRPAREGQRYKFEIRSRSTASCC